MKMISAIVMLCSIQVAAQAATWDSVGVFLRAEKSVILINEDGAKTWPGSKIHQLMDALHANSELEFLNDDESIKLSCGRNEKAGICTFRFLPSSNVSILPKSVEAKIERRELAHAGLRASGVDGLALEFYNSNGDVLKITGDPTHLVITGRKR